MTAVTSISRLWLEQFRSIESADLALGPGLTVFVGANAQGKTSLLEAVGWIARGRSFRGVGDSVLVSTGSERAIVRAEITSGERTQLFEAEINAQGRNRVQVNRSIVTRRRDLHDLLRVTVFSPDDLDIVKGGPAARRDFVDELLASMALRYDAARTDYERIVRHRNALLRAGIRDETDRTTRAVFDEQLVVAGAELLRGRLRLLDRLSEAVASAYRDLAGATATVGTRYHCDWYEGVLDTDDSDFLREALRGALEQAQRRETERRVTLVGPHRDEVLLSVSGLDARTYASQGEQRTLALALRLGGHRLLHDLVGVAPVLMLDDVFSELDDRRSAALVAALPAGQTLLTTASVVPHDVIPERTVQVVAGKLIG